MLGEIFTMPFPWHLEGPLILIPAIEGQEGLSEGSQRASVERRIHVGRWEVRQGLGSAVLGDSEKRINSTMGCQRIGDNSETLCGSAS